MSSYVNHKFIGHDLEKSEKRRKSRRGPHKLRIKPLGAPLYCASVYSLMSCETMWNFILSHCTRKTTYDEILGNPLCCVALAFCFCMTVSVTGVYVVCLFRHSWTYVRACCITTLSILFLDFVLEYNGIFFEADQTVIRWAVRIAGRANWTMIYLVAMMILLGDEVEGPLGYVTGYQTQRKTPWCEMEGWRQ